MLKKYTTIPALLIIAAAFSLHAQNPKRQQLVDKTGQARKIAGYTEGKTRVTEVVFTGLDSPVEDADYEIERPIYERNLLSYFKEHSLVFQPDKTLDLDQVERAIILTHEYVFQRGYFEPKIKALGEKLPHDRMRLIISVDRGFLGRVSDIRFLYAWNFADGELEGVMRGCMGANWGTYDKRMVDYYAQKCLREYLFAAGYLEAKVFLISEKFNKATVEFIYGVGEGPRYRIGELRFKGSTLFTEKEIIEKLGLSKGDIADGKRFRKFLDADLANIYHDQGYIDYAAEWHIDWTKPSESELDGTVDIRTTIDEGPQFTVTKISFNGVEPDEQRDLLREFATKPGEVFNESKFKKEIDRLNDLNKYRHIDKDRDTEFRTDEEKGRLEIKINLKPAIPNQ